MSKQAYLDYALQYVGTRIGTSNFNYLKSVYESNTPYTYGSNWCGEYNATIAILAGEQDNFSMVDYSLGQYEDLTRQGKKYIYTHSEWLALPDEQKVPCLCFDQDPTAPEQYPINHSGIGVRVNGNRFETVEGSYYGDTEVALLNWDINDSRFIYFYIPEQWGTEPVPPTPTETKRQHRFKPWLYYTNYRR